MDQKQPLVSIVIPNFNRASLLEATLQSVKAQTYAAWECMVVDDGSTDHSKEVVDKYISSDHRFRFLERPMDQPKGANACRNYGLDLAQGTYINFLDSDDLLAPTKLAHDVEQLEHSDADFTICQTHFFDTETGEFFKYWNENLFSKTPIHDFITLRIGWSTNAPLWRKSSLTTNSLQFDPKLKNGQDYLFHASALIKGMTPAVTKEVLVLQREHLDKIEHQVIKAPAKALINSRLLSLKSELEPRTVNYLKVQSLRILSALFKHKMWAEGVRYGMLLVRYHSISSCFTIAKLTFFGTIYSLTSLGYRFLNGRKEVSGDKSNDKP